MSSLRTNYKDDVFTGSRKYEMTQNGDGTVSFTDQTTYSQVGDTYGAAQINEANAIVNNLDDKAYLSDDGTESGLADNDTFPFFDISANARKKTTWSNIKNLIKAICAIKDHASSTASTYGAGTASQFGHVKLSDKYLSSDGSASNSVGASSAAVSSAYTKINNQLKANNKEIYMDYKNGKYGYNTSANRGADTFFPFNDGSKMYYLGAMLIGNLSEPYTNFAAFYAVNDKKTNISWGSNAGGANGVDINGVGILVYYNSGWIIIIISDKAGKLYGSNLQGYQLITTFGEGGGRWVSEAAYYVPYSTFYFEAD